MFADGSLRRRSHREGEAAARSYGCAPRLSGEAFWKALCGPDLPESQAPPWWRPLGPGGWAEWAGSRPVVVASSLALSWGEASGFKAGQIPDLRQVQQSASVLKDDASTSGRQRGNRTTSREHRLADAECSNVHSPPRSRRREGRGRRKFRTKRTGRQRLRVCGILPRMIVTAARNVALCGQRVIDAIEDALRKEDVAPGRRPIVRVRS